MDFDDVAGEYNELLRENLKKYGEDIAYYAAYKVARMKHYAANKNPRAILDFGCGVGRNMPFLRRYFPESEIWGCDTSLDSLRVAQADNPQCSFFSSVERPSQRFDLVLVSCVFHHIPPEERSSVMETIASWMNPAAELFVFEHNPYNPITRRVVNTCPFDKDAILLTLSDMTRLIARAALQVLTKQYTLFFPAFLKQLQFLETFLYGLPLGGQYMVRAKLIR